MAHFWLCHAAYEILVPQPGMSQHPLHWQHRVLTTGPPQKSQKINHLKMFILLLGMHTEETRIEKDTCTPVFITTLFTIARTWKQPRYPSTDEWIRKLWYIYTMEYYSAFKKNAFESVLMRWMKLKPIIHSEVSQKEKYQYSILVHIYGI